MNVLIKMCVIVIVLLKKIINILKIFIKVKLISLKNVKIHNYVIYILTA
jgi:hypothetical protein